MEIGLALSGGGIRAAVFHLGVLRHLAEKNLLERISQISTVSGGSLSIAALFSVSNMQWPASTIYLNNSYPALRKLITTKDILSFKAIGWNGLFKYNFGILNNRANILAQLLKRRWNIAGMLRDLPDNPSWWINTTCLETGKNWRFSKREMGDWQFGRHYDPPVSIAEAVTASAAVPYVIGALSMTLPQEGWYRTDPATRQPLARSTPLSTKVRFWDGGAYENLGLETLFKPQQGLIGCDFLICSDASGPLPAIGRKNITKLFKGNLAVPRLFDICSDQIRALRSRMFVSALTERKIKGALLRMGNSVRDIDIKSGQQRSLADYDNFLTDQDVALAIQYPTGLMAMSEIDFDRIARHGYETADSTLQAYAGADLSCL